MKGNCNIVTTGIQCCHNPAAYSGKFVTTTLTRPWDGFVEQPCHSLGQLYSQLDRN